MKMKLIDVETNAHEAQVGSCEYCFSIRTIHEPVYIVEIDGTTYRVQGYSWMWGHYDEYVLENVIQFAEYLSTHEFKSEEDLEPEQLFYCILRDYCEYGGAEEYELKQD
ncbi:hypothetical protein ACTGYP_00225 [Streptococcus suis]